MNWNALKTEIESMTDEQRMMDVILLNEYDEVVEIDDAVWWNKNGHTHTGDDSSPNLEPNQPYITGV